MKYDLEFKPKSLKDCKSIPRQDLDKIFEKIEAMTNDLAGDVKQLTNHSPEYRLRVGSYRILFEIEDNKISVYRIRHRRDIYK